MSRGGGRGLWPCSHTPPLMGRRSATATVGRMGTQGLDPENELMLFPDRKQICLAVQTRFVSSVTCIFRKRRESVLTIDFEWRQH